MKPPLLLRASRALRVSQRLRPRSARGVSGRDSWGLVRGLLLRGTELRRRRAIRDPARPLVFVVGAPRSGSTLLSQLAARCLDVGYIANAVAPYWLTPLVGWDRFLARGPLDRSAIPVESRFGTTRGAESPHEFGYFFRTWMDLSSSDELDAGALSRSDLDEIRAALEGVAGRFAAPVVVKNMNAASFQVRALAAAIPQARFVHISRDRGATIESILAARKVVRGDEREWWSIRPAAWMEWRALPPREQVERQVDGIRSAVTRELLALPAERRLVLELEAIRADPRAELRRLAGFLGLAARLDRLPPDGVSPA